MLIFFPLSDFGAIYLGLQGSGRVVRGSRDILPQQRYRYNIPPPNHVRIRLLPHCLFVIRNRVRRPPASAHS
jgi:hypothetical protein